MRTLAAALCLLLLAALPAAAREDYTIRSKEGDVIRVTHQPLQAPEPDDRADICFAVSSRLKEGKTIMMNFAPVFVWRGAAAGPVCKTILTGRAYQPFDIQEQGFDQQRREAFGEDPPPQATYAQIAFYRDLGLTDRLDLLTRQPLQDFYTEEGREVVLPIQPGYRTTLTWLSGE
jgi:hypothetical protein